MPKLKLSTAFLKHHSLRRIVLIGSCTLVGLMLIGMTGLAWYATVGLPSLDSLDNYQPSLISRIHADDGQLIGQFYTERRVFIPFEEIPSDLIHAIVAVEDARFFEHPGLDIWGIFRAAWTNIKQGGTVEGASTITQQLARSLFLSPERTYSRKIRELILAFKMEFILTKEQILEQYLNQIYFGHGAYGIGTAALTYFEKDLNAITLPEAAFLAGLPKAPSTYSPYKNPERSKRRQEHVLHRMVQAGYITEALAKEAVATLLSYQRLTLERIAPYFLEQVRQHLVNEYGEPMVYKGGLQVFTTLNTRMQRLAEMAIRHGLRQLDKRQGWRGPLGHEPLPLPTPDVPRDIELTIQDMARTDHIHQGVVTAVDQKQAIVVANGIEAPLALKDMRWARRRIPKNALVTEARTFPEATPQDLLKPGDIIEVRLKVRSKGVPAFILEQTPIVEGALLALDPRTGSIKAMVGGYDFERSQFNRALMARRQPGSAFKPIIYATALDNNLTPATLIMDAPLVYEQEEEEKIWKPENYEKRFFGTITIREALRHSRNAATIRLLNQIGVRRVIDFSKSLGIASPLSQDLSLALGSSGITLEELTAAYGVFANQGMVLSPYTITLVKNQQDTMLEQHLFEPRQVVSQNTAYLITNLMMDVIQSGTGRGAKSIGRPIAGKTGTTNQYKDAWFVGYAPNLAVGIWVGFDEVQTLGRVESGAHAALPIWTQFMKHALKDLPVMTFSVPAGIQFAEIENSTGKLATQPSQTTTTEVFAQGTAPTKPNSPFANPLDFYELDLATP
ncbi:MAG: PBP1A family penicillin-binding protein [Nitrospirales bacterium]|nr:PBP1A family penicillin-binding protein [Nitrospirales bacterium]